MFVDSLLFMEEGKDPEPIAAPVKPVSAWDKFVSTTLKSIRISYMNWTYLPRSTGEQETWQQRLLRYSHFPMATQFFAYFAYRAACQVFLVIIVFLVESIWSIFPLFHWNPVFPPRSELHTFAYVQCTKS